MAKKRYKNVTEMVRDLADEQFADDFDRQESERRLVNQLFALRSSRGISQTEIASKLECSQGRISKLEAANDRDLHFGDIVDYAKAIGFGVTIQLMKSDATLIDRVKFHVFSIKRLLGKLVKLCSGDDQMEKAGGKFFAELNFNMLKIVLDAHSQMLTRSNGSWPGVCIEVCEEDAEDELHAVSDKVAAG